MLSRLSSQRTVETARGRTGFDGGRHPLALHVGVDVAGPVIASVAAVSLEKTLEKLPHLVSLAKPVRVSLEKHRLSAVKAQVAFVLDASGSMTAPFKRGNVQKVLERVVARAVQFDDGSMPVWAFGEKCRQYEDVSLHNLEGYIDRIRNDGKRTIWEILPGLGGTNNEPPVLEAINQTYRDATLPVFYKFSGLGGNNDGVLGRLDTFTDRLIDKTHFPD
nr:VWA domain-containing protein [uncultured Pantoea sp.]